MASREQVSAEEMNMPKLTVIKPGGFFTADERVSFDVTPLGKGSFTRAFKRGNTAYLVSTDNAKEILSGIEKHKYIPETKAVGNTPKGDPVYTQPVYFPLKAANAVAWNQAKQLRKCHESAFTAVLAYSKSRKIRIENLGYMIIDQTIDCAKAHKLAPGLIKALRALGDAAADYGSDWTFEFPTRNLAVTSKGTLVLLDVIYSIRDVQAKNFRNRR
jgi:hypothetical protein